MHTFMYLSTSTAARTSAMRACAFSWATALTSGSNALSSSMKAWVNCTEQGTPFDYMK